MTTIKRPDFVQNHANKSLDVSRLTDEVDQQLRASGSTAADISLSDLDGDGKIQGAQELKHLFRHLDSFDRNGSSQSFLANDPSTGESTRAGRVYSALSVLFQEAAGVDTVAPSDTLQDFGSAVAEAGAESIDTRMNAHLDSIDRTGVGLYFGDHSSLNSMSVKERQDWIDSRALEGTNPPTASELRKSSCIEWAMENVGAAYIKAGKAERWNEIRRTVLSNGAKGTDLAIELQKDGWEGVYWNPDARNPDDGNNEHPYTAAITARGKAYYGIDVDHRVVDYRPTEGKGTELNMEGIERLREVPFFFGLAKGGKHTFVGRDGKVNEFHWSDMPDSKNAIEERPLEEFPWNSGVIMVPPGTWPTH